jgi:hypothetical protein
MRFDRSAISPHIRSGEADWLLEVIEALFDFYFSQPKAAERRRERLNKKLGDAGKPPLKKPAR